MIFVTNSIVINYDRRLLYKISHLQENCSYYDCRVLIYTHRDFIRFATDVPTHDSVVVKHDCITFMRLTKIVDQKLEQKSLMSKAILSFGDLNDCAQNYLIFVLTFHLLQSFWAT